MVSIARGTFFLPPVLPGVIEKPDGRRLEYGAQPARTALPHFEFFLGRLLVHCEQLDAGR